MKSMILVVEDDVQIRESLAKVLRAEGHDVVLAADGLEGIRKFEPQHIDLLILDINLPEKNGWATLEALTEINPLVPVIMITGLKNQLKWATTTRVGALMEKPLDVPLLIKTIAELLAEPAESRLERLAGLRDCIYFGPPRSECAGIPWAQPRRQ